VTHAIIAFLTFVFCFFIFWTVAPASKDFSPAATLETAKSIQLPESRAPVSKRNAERNRCGTEVRGGRAAQQHACRTRRLPLSPSSARFVSRFKHESERLLTKQNFTYDMRDRIEV
jgi:hypothetical protein